MSTCRSCGCDDFRSCPGGCYWVQQDLCSRCADEEGMEEEIEEDDDEL